MATTDDTRAEEAQSLIPAPDPSDELKYWKISKPLSDGIYSQLAHVERVASMLRVTATSARWTSQELEIEELSDVARTLEAIDLILTYVRDALDGIAMGHVPGKKMRS